MKTPDTGTRGWCPLYREFPVGRVVLVLLALMPLAYADIRSTHGSAGFTTTRLAPSEPGGVRALRRSVALDHAHRLADVSGTLEESAPPAPTRDPWTSGGPCCSRHTASWD
jgi:hypothetical protein